RMIAKADIRRVQEWMGHADIQTTMRYLHYAPRAEDAALGGHDHERRRLLERPAAAPWALPRRLGWRERLVCYRRRQAYRHDGGRTWTLVSVPRSPRPDSISVADGTVWANASRCRAPYRCVYPVLHGPASGSRLTPVPTTPSDRGDLNIIAVSSSSAYMFSPAGDAGARQAWITDDGGRTWQHIAPGCPESLVTVFPTVGDGHGTIWRSCGNSNGAPDSDGHQRLGISTDGGRPWVYRSVPFSIRTLYPESARIAWAQNQSGTTLRTDDGGRSWHAVWSLKNNLLLSRGSIGHDPTLTPQSAVAATEVVPVTHTDARDHDNLTNMLAYRTTDAGAHWRRMAVALPHRS
ncbi:MAG: hypothetical protein ACRDNS_26225, partial [Trebonia sp.]